MAKVHKLSGSDMFSHVFFCEGCRCGHGFNATLDRQPRWSFNNDLERPTISPSILVQSGNENGPTVCHSFVTDGRIQYLSDCTHHLAGQTIDLPDL